jgi:hypothetical protein
MTQEHAGTMRRSSGKLAQQHSHEVRGQTLTKSTVIRELLAAAGPATGAQAG